MADHHDKHGATDTDGVPKKRNSVVSEVAAAVNRIRSNMSLSSQSQANAADEPVEKAEQGTKKGSRVLTTGSRGSSGTTAEHRFAREISETFTIRLREMKWCILALACNVLMLVAVRAMATGVVVNLQINLVQTLEGIVMELLLLITNLLTIVAMDTGYSAFFGYQLATRGRSMAVIGFSQASSIFKVSYANDISLNSSVRKVLNRLALIWAITEFLKLLTPIGASALHADVVRVDQGTVNCVNYGQDGVPVDRKFPNVKTEFGVAELVFGKSIGRLRSEEAVDVTTAIVGPQLTGVVMNGDTIVGHGYQIDISTHCLCTANDTAASMEEAGVLPAVSAAFSTQASSSDRRNIYVVNSLVNEPDQGSFNVTSVLLNTPLCGGLDSTSVPVCTTRFWNHTKAEIMIQYMTDGTTASIAQKFAFTRSIIEQADVNTWAYSAMEFMLGAGVQQFAMPSQVPGSLTSLLWWASSDLMCIDPALVCPKYTTNSS